MRKVMLVGIMMLTVLSLLATNFTMSGDFRTRMSLANVYGEYENQSRIDSRAQLSFNAEIEKGLNFVYTLRTGDVVWGDNQSDNWSNNIDVKTHHAYVQWLCPFTAVDAKVGYQSWYDHMSLVMDDDFPAIIITKENVIPNLTLQAGYAVLEEQTTPWRIISFYDPIEDEYYDIEEYDETDTRFMMLNADHKLSESMGWGVNMLFRTREYEKEYTYFDMWFMPYFMFNQNGLNLDAMFAYNHGSYAKAYNGKDVSNGGIAFALKGSYDTQGFGVPAIDFLYTSGDDGKDPESTSKFHIISNFYQNGLELYGIGINDGINAPINDNNWFEPGNNGLGLMSLVLKYSYPVTENFEAKAAFGLLSSGEKNPDTDKTDMATEIDLGFNYNIYKNYTFKAVGAMAMPGEFYGKDLENIYELSGVLEVKF